VARVPGRRLPRCRESGDGDCFVAYVPAANRGAPGESRGRGDEISVCRTAGSRAPEFVMNNDIESVVLKHLAYCRAHEWAGIDPYDALNSKLLTALPFLDSRLLRIALTQALKRSPINIRHLLRIEKTQNPKALACFLSGSLKLAG